MTVWDDARALIGEGEPDIALDLVDSFLKGRLSSSLAERVRPLLDTVVLLKARGRRLATSSIKGILTPNDTQVERARLDQAILGLIAEAEHMDNLRAPRVAVNLP